MLMSKEKKYNSLLLLFGVSATALAIYFGLKNNELSNKLSKTNHEFETQQSLLVNDSIAVIDSLLFAGSYKKALQLSKELKQTKKFSVDSVLQLRYNLASEIVAAKNDYAYLKPKTEKVSSVSNNSSTVNNEQKTEDSKFKKEEEHIASSTKQLAAKSTAGEYLTFETTKGTKLHYIGYIKNNEANGHGIAILDSGSRYEGQWKNNKRHGYGKFYWDDGDYYEGTYIKDKRNGMGTYYWKNGEKYIGEWKNDQRNGKGQFFSKKGKLKASGIWENDVLIKQEKKH